MNLSEEEGDELIDKEIPSMKKKMTSKKPSD